MNVPNPDAEPTDVLEQQRTAAPDSAAEESAGSLLPETADKEANVADVVEQHQEAWVGGSLVLSEPAADADPVDAAEQAAALPANDDDYEHEDDREGHRA